MNAVAESLTSKILKTLHSSTISCFRMVSRQASIMERSDRESGKIMFTGIQTGLRQAASPMEKILILTRHHQEPAEMDVILVLSSISNNYSIIRTALFSSW